VKTLTVRLPEQIVADIEAESRQRNLSKSDVVRERLEVPYQVRGKARKNVNTLDLIADLIGSVRGLPPDLGARKKHYLRVTGYGKKHSR
jgi:Arc/MetJ-type ribon-helix-helix transcriptional regulator